MTETTSLQKVRVGSRKSELAMIQTNGVIEKLKQKFPDVAFEVVTMETIGDFVQEIPLSSIGQSNLFTKELEKALAAGQVDMLVHSMKDLPSKLPEGMIIAAVCERDDPFDALVLHSRHRGRTLDTLPEGSVIGTSSVRRIALLKHSHPHLKFKDVRGNVNTRLRKLDEGKDYDGLILATAGMQRMGWDHRISQVLNDPKCLYATSQGALGVEVLEQNSSLIKMLSTLNHPETVLQCICERALLKTLQGGCSAPVAVRTEITKEQLAMIQTNGVIEKLKQKFPDVAFEVVTMETIGDFVQEIPLSSIGQSNLFTKELEKALAAGQVDMLVHSMKDLPSKLPEGMIIAAVCERDDPFDALVLHSRHRGRTLDTLPEGSVIGTSSVRRIALLKHSHPHLKFKDVRGNVNTRLRKLDEGKDYDGLILATAGMQRMGWDHRISQVLNDPKCLYATSQGALGVEVLEQNSSLIKMLSTLNHPETVLQCICERALLKTLQGGCSAPVAVRTEITKEQLQLTAASLSLDGSEMISKVNQSQIPGDLQLKIPADNTDSYFSSVVAPNICHSAMTVAEQLGVSVAEDLLKMGADKILKDAREEIERRRSDLST